MVLVFWITACVWYKIRLAALEQQIAPTGTQHSFLHTHPTKTMSAS